VGGARDFPVVAEEEAPSFPERRKALGERPRGWGVDRDTGELRIELRYLGGVLNVDLGGALLDGTARSVATLDEADMVARLVVRYRLDVEERRVAGSRRPGGVRGR